MKISIDPLLPLEWFSPLSDHVMGVAPEEADILITTFYQKVRREDIEQYSNLKLVVQFGVGYDNIDVAACLERGIMVTNTPTPVIEPTAELCMALMMDLSRRIAELDRKIRGVALSPDEEPFNFGLMKNLGHSLIGKTLGIIGLGNIGRSVARRAKANLMPVLYHNRHRLDTQVEQQLGVEYRNLDELLQSSDIVSLNLPANASSHHIIGERELHLMKPSAYLINTARGAVVDEQVLIRALREGWIAGAALDVYEREPLIPDELKALPNCVLVPHIGTATWECRRAMADAMIENIIHYCKGEFDQVTFVPECKNQLK